MQKILKLLLVLLTFSSVLTTSCKNPLNSNLNVYSTEDYILNSEKLSSKNTFCHNLYEKDICCNKAMIKEHQQAFEIFKGKMHIHNASQVLKLDENIRNILINKEKALDAVESYNTALEGIDFTMTLLELIRDNLPETTEDDHGLNITQDGSLFLFEIDGEKYDISGEDMDEYFTDNASALKKAIDAIDSALKNIIDLKIFEDSPIFIREKKGDHHSLKIDKIALEKEFDLSQDRIREHLKEREKCFSSLLQHFGSTRCLQCEADWKTLGIEIKVTNTANILLALSKSTCTNFMEKCHGYIDTFEGINANTVLYAYTRSSAEMVDSGSLPDNSFNGLEDISDELSFLSKMQSEMLQALQNTLYFIKPDDCKNSNDCEMICRDFITSYGVDLKQVFDSNLEQNYDSLVDTVSDFIDEIDEDDDNDDRRNLVEDQMNSNTIQFTTDNTLNTIEYSKGMNADFTFDPTSGINIFNYTGKATVQDLYLKPKVTDDEDGSSILTFSLGLLILLFFNF